MLIPPTDAQYSPARLPHRLLKPLDGQITIIGLPFHIFNLSRKEIALMQYALPTHLVSARSYLRKQCTAFMHLTVTSIAMV